MTKTRVVVANAILAFSQTVVAAEKADSQLSTRIIPKEMKLMIASFGTIETQTEVEQWLSDQLRPHVNTDGTPAPSVADLVVNPDMLAEAVAIDWEAKKLRYFRTNEEIRRENSRRAQILTNLKTDMLSNDAKRYTQLGKDYLHSAIRKLKGGKLIKVIDRGNMTIQQTEKHLKDESTDCTNGADCILSVVLGDREEESKTIPLDMAGTKIKRTTYTAPYVGKVRDLDGNILLSFDGTASVRQTTDNVIESVSSDPARKLIEKICEKIAKELVGYFTSELRFRIKVPKGFDPYDVVISVDGSEVDSESVRVLSCEHLICAELDGCNPVKRIVGIDDGTDKKIIRINFKKSDNSK